MATTSLPHATLYHTNFDAFATALCAVAPDLQQQAAEYRATAEQRGLVFNERECLGAAIAIMLEVVGPADEDEIEPDYDPIYAYDYNDEELMACGPDRY